ncbi:MAG: hypothetical protein AAF577_12935 [Pseudomonadota bacterium]
MSGLKGVAIGRRTAVAVTLGVAMVIGLAAGAESLARVLGLGDAESSSPLAASFATLCLPGGEDARLSTDHAPENVLAAAVAAGFTPVHEMEDDQQIALAHSFAEEFGAPLPPALDGLLDSAPVLTADLSHGGVASAGAVSLTRDDGHWQQVCFLNGIEEATGDPQVLAGAVEASIGARLAPVEELTRTLEHDGVTQRFEWQTRLDDIEIAVIIRHRVVNGRGFLAGAVSRMGLESEEAAPDPLEGGSLLGTRG